MVQKSLRLAVVIFAITAAATGCSLKDGSRIGATGSLLVDDTQPAKVFVDGTERGMTNQVIAGISVGRHTVKVLSETDEWTKDVLITDGATVRMDEQTSPEDENLGMTLEEQEELEQNSLLDGEGLTGDDNNVSLTDPVFSDEVLDKAIGTVPVTTDMVTSDFSQRDKLPQTTVPKSKWKSYGTWGPPAAKYPVPSIPANVDKTAWKRARIAAVAKKYIGLRYQHKHIPALGLDCSNYTSWVYNYGLGIKFTSAVSTQGSTVGKWISKYSKLEVGDLIYFKSSGKIVHVGIYLGNNQIIDESTMNKYGVAIKRLDTGWPKSHFSHARRVIL